MKKRDGFALMAALWLVVLIGATGYELSALSRTRRLAIVNALERTQGDAAADAMIETVRALLERRLVNAAETTMRSRDAQLDPWGDLASLSADSLSLGDERAVAYVYDASSRLQLNKATEGDLRRLFIAVHVDADLASRLSQRILDWRDPDDIRRVNGAARDDYLRAGARVLPSNADFRVTAELQNVEGMTPELFARMSSLVTTRGSGTINANSASREVLLSLPGFGDEAASVVIRARQNRTPIRSLDELTKQLSGGGRNAIADAMSELNARLSFDTREVVAEVEGWVDGSPVRARLSTVYERTGDAVLVKWRGSEP